MSIAPLSGVSITKSIPVRVEAHHECDQHGDVSVNKRFLSAGKAREWADNWLDSWDCY